MSSIVSIPLSQYTSILTIFLHFRFSISVINHRKVETASDSCKSTNKWTGKQLLLSPVAGSKVNQESALYRSRTCLRTSQVVVESRG